MRTLALIVGAFVLVGFCTSQINQSDNAATSNRGSISNSQPSEQESTSTEPLKSTESANASAPPSSKSTVREKTTAQPQPSPVTEKRQKLYPVLDVIDGDTVEVGYHGGVSIRVIGIDTPETVHPSQPDECWGPAASAAATRLLQGRRVALEFDPTQGRTDAFGRTLAYMQIPGIGDFGYTMIKRGHAAEYTYDTAYQRQARYRAAERRARALGRAMWGHCGGPDVPLHTAAPAPAPAPEPKQQTAGGGGCAPGYDPCVPPYPPDVDCADVDGPISVSGTDPHGLDADGDGLACE